MYTDSFKDEYIGKYYFEALLDENRNSVEIERKRQINTVYKNISSLG